MNNTIYGLVLAGGESRRMGQDKAVLLRDGETQLAFLTGMLAQHVDRVFVSAREAQRNDPERTQYDLIVDAVDAQGPVAGILSAAMAYPDIDWLVLACDLPNIDDKTLAHLIARRSATQPFTAYRSSYDGLPEPLCAVYRAGSDAIVRQFVSDGIYCPRKILIRSDTLLLEQPNPRALDNVNTPDDLQDSILEVHA